MASLRLSSGKPGRLRTKINHFPGKGKQLDNSEEGRRPYCSFHNNRLLPQGLNWGEKKTQPKNQLLLGPETSFFDSLCLFIKLRRKLRRWVKTARSRKL